MLIDYLNRLSSRGREPLNYLAIAVVLSFACLAGAACTSNRDRGEPGRLGSAPPIPTSRWSATAIAQQGNRPVSQTPLLQASTTPVATLVVAATSTSVPAARAATSTPTAASSGLSAAQISQAEQLMLRLINENRRTANSGSLVWDDTASLAARRHAKDMADAGYFSHTDLRGTGPMERYRDVGGKSNGVGENIYTMPGNGILNDAQLADAIRAGQEAFMKSEGHRNNIMNSSYKTAGVGVFYDPVKKVLMIVQVFTWG